MKKLFENYRKFLLQENYERENIRMLYKLIVPGSHYDETFFEKFGIDANDAKVLNALANIKVLRNNKIIKEVGAGKYGITYQLDNDHILKFFLSSHNPSSPEPSSGQDDLIKYKSMRNRQFQGVSHKGEPAIYDLGEIEIPEEHGIKILYYVELGKVTPFKQWLKLTGENQGNWETLIYFLGDYVHDNYEELKGKNSRYFISGFINYIKSKFNIDSNYDPNKKTKKEYNDVQSDDLLKEMYEPSEEFEFSKNKKDDKFERFHNLINSVSRTALASLLKGLSNYINKTGNITDFHPGNFGVIMSNSSKDPDIFVFFDI